MQLLGENLWWCGYPLTLLGADLRRNVSVIRLANKDLVIHSTAPFTGEDVERISKLGRVRWVLDAMLDHDTFARDGKKAFPDAVFLAPEGFSERVGFRCGAIVPPPPEWGEELQVIRIEGVPAYLEHAFFHQPSRTLIVADLIMNFDEVPSPWTRLLVRAGIGRCSSPGTSRRLKFSIRDKEAFRRSVARMMEWDFERVIVGHGNPLTENAHARVLSMFHREGWL